MKQLLNTDYKGSRHYVHGSDLFNSITGELRRSLDYQQHYISQLIFTRFTYHLCELVMDEQINASAEAEVVGKGVITSGSNRKTFSLVETQTPPFGRYPFDEEDLVEQAIYGDNSIRLDKSSNFTSIEMVIALTKALSYKLMPLALDGEKWIFGRIDLDTSLPSIKSHVTIKQLKAIQGRFSINNIEIDGESVGKIQFITGNP